VKKLIKAFHKNQKGFTLMELLIVVAILSVIAGVVILNLGRFLAVGTLAGANIEAVNVKAAAVAYYAEQNPPAWPSTSDYLGDKYLAGTLRATYYFYEAGEKAGLIHLATPVDPGGWVGIRWDEPTQKWVRAQ